MSRTLALKGLKLAIGDLLVGQHRHFVGQPLEKAVGRVTGMIYVNYGPVLVKEISVRLPHDRIVELTIDLPWGDLITLDTELPMEYRISSCGRNLITAEIDFDRLEAKFSIKQ